MARKNSARKNVAVQENAAAQVAGHASGQVDLGPLSDWVGYHLRMAQIASFQAVARRTKEMGQRPGRFATLLVIGRNPGISQTALSRANGRDKSSLTPVLADLVRKKLVRRTRMAEDRRSYQLFLTAAGEKVLRELLAHIHRHEAQLDAIIGPRDRASFLRILSKIATELL